MILWYKSKPTETRKPGELGNGGLRSATQPPQSAASAKEKRRQGAHRGPPVLALTLISCSKRLCICSSCSSCFLLSWFWFRCSSFWSSRSSRSSWRLRVKRCGHRSQNVASEIPEPQRRALKAGGGAAPHWGRGSVRTRAPFDIYGRTKHSPP